MPPPAGPTILALNTDVRSLTQGERVTISAIVTDPDGIEDLIGGILETADGAALGAYATADQEGAYGHTVTWEDLHRVRPIAFDAGDDDVRELVAVFSDAAGNRTRQTLEIKLHCEGDTACEGVCANLASDPDHCGDCDTVCPTLEVQAECAAGQCGQPCDRPDVRHACGGECVDVEDNIDACGGCGVVCGGDLGERPRCAGLACAVTEFADLEVEASGDYPLDFPVGGGAWVLLRPDAPTHYFLSAGSSTGFQSWRVTEAGPWVSVRDCWNGTCSFNQGLNAGTDYVRIHRFDGRARLRNLRAQVQ